jgi:hypothetical protein
VLHGFGARPYTWDVSGELQHQLTPTVSVTGGYYRNWTGNIRVLDNLAVTPQDYTSFCITAPIDARLPGGGGYPVCGLYDLIPSKFGVVDNLVTQASHYGEYKSHNDFVGVNVRTRFGSRLQAGGGVDTGRIVNDSCFTIDSPQQQLYSLPGAGQPSTTQQLYCRVITPWKANLQVKANGSYELPAGVVVAATFQNYSGPQILANYPATNAEIAPMLGRNLGACGTAVIAPTACTATVTVPLIAPQTQFEDRRSQLDFRVGKLFRLGSRARLQANIDLYNALNASPITGVNTAYGREWLRPTQILPARSVQLNGQVNF